MSHLFSQILNQTIPEPTKKIQENTDNLNHQDDISTQTPDHNTSYTNNQDSYQQYFLTDDTQQGDQSDNDLQVSKQVQNVKQCYQDYVMEEYIQNPTQQSLNVNHSQNNIYLDQLNCNGIQSPQPISDPLISNYPQCFEDFLYYFQSPYQLNIQDLQQLQPQNQQQNQQLQQYQQQWKHEQIPKQNFMSLEQQNSQQKLEPQQQYPQQQLIQQEENSIQYKQIQENHLPQNNNNIDSNDYHDSQSTAPNSQETNQEYIQEEKDQEPNPEQNKPKKKRNSRDVEHINKKKKTLDQVIFMTVLLIYYQYKAKFPGKNFPYTDQEIQNILNHNSFLTQDNIDQLIKNLNDFKQSKKQKILGRKRRSPQLCFPEHTILDSFNKNIRIFHFLYNNFPLQKINFDNNYQNINRYYLSYKDNSNKKIKIYLKKQCADINKALIDVLLWQIDRDQSKHNINKRVIDCLQNLVELQQP